jgi:nitrate reductase NapAB chaperone NapD
MIIASGFVEANEQKDVDAVIDRLRAKGVEVGDVNGEKIIYLIERETSALLKREIESLKDIEGIRNVYLTYFSLEGSDESAS